jgi:hypothetical protein
MIAYCCSQGLALPKRRGLPVQILKWDIPTGSKEISWWLFLGVYKNKKPRLIKRGFS